MWPLRKERALIFRFSRNKHTKTCTWDAKLQNTTFLELHHACAENVPPSHHATADGVTKRVSLEKRERKQHFVQLPSSTLRPDLLALPRFKKNISLQQWRMHALQHTTLNAHFQRNAPLYLSFLLFSLHLRRVQTVDHLRNRHKQ